MTQINNGGSAFPTAKVSINGETATDGVELYGSGMSLRDWFAGQALAGDLATQSGEMGIFENGTPDYFLKDRAQFFYRYADAMLAARDGSASV